MCTKITTIEYSLKGISNYLLKENAKLKKPRKEIKECTVKLDVLKNRTNL